MIVLVLNCGSSSVKYALYDAENKAQLVNGNKERIGMEGGARDHKEAIMQILDSLVNGEDKVIEDIDQINAVGHRVVHGGDKFNKSVLINEEVLATIKKVAALAPLHNPPNIVGIESARQVLPNVPQVAVFDTAFHQTMPEEAYLYPVPYEWYEKYGVRRYGFHGSSHLYVAKRAAVMLGKKFDEVNLITLHIGNGVSFSAIKNGVCVDTSMGLTPLEGAMMGTRSGDIDPAIIGFMCDKLGISVAEVISILNKKSGHLGITEKYTDRRDISKAMAEHDNRAQLSMDMETYRIKKYIGAYLAVLGKVDAIVFTAGVGENHAFIREKAVEGLELLGLNLDIAKNSETRSKSGETVISTVDSRIKIFMIPTDEEAVLVEDVVAIINGTYDVHTNYSYSFQK